MYSSLIRKNTLIYPKIHYSREHYFSNIMKANREQLYDYVDKGNWVLFNQNPLVQFLSILSLDIEADDEYLFHYIASKMNGLASQLNMTSIYNKGHTFNQVVFPEKDHHTLLLVPFGHSAYYSMNDYFTTDIDNLKPLRTLYTTDTRIRFAINRMTETVSPGGSAYSIVQVDPFALAIGYVRYCRDRISEGHYLGLTPHSYLAKLPLASFYVEHNQTVFTQLLGKHRFTVDQTKWTKVPFTEELDKYLIWLKQTQEGIVFKSFNHYVSQVTGIPEVSDNVIDGIFPHKGLTGAFKQMSWIYDYSAMQWSLRYLTLLDKQGRQDSVFKSGLKGIFKQNLTSMTTSISDPLWKAHYKGLYLDLKDKIT